MTAGAAAPAAPAAVVAGRRTLTHQRWRGAPGQRAAAAPPSAPGGAGSDDGGAPAGGGGGGAARAPPPPPPVQQQQAAAVLLRGLALLHAALGAAACLAPAWCLRGALLGPLAAPGTATSLQLVGGGAYLWLLSGCLVCLKDAALHARLASDTYKRLALGVMYQCLVLVVLLVRHKQLLAGHVLGAGVGVFVATAVVAARLYAGSVGGFSLQFVVRSLAANLADLFKPQNITSAFYAVCALLSLVQFVWLFPAPSTPLLATDLGPVALLLSQAGAAGMVLSGVVWYTLKDAADRGRLAASTFRQLNLAMAVVAALQLWALWRMSALGVPLDHQLWKALMACGAAVVVTCDWQFFFSRKPQPPQQPAGQ